MQTNKRENTHHLNELRLTLDARKRISLAKLLPDYQISSFKAYMEGDRIILEPLAEIPAHELWLHKNPSALKSVKKSLKNKGRHNLGSFAHYLDENDEI